MVKHNPEVNWKDSKIKFTRCLGSYRIKYQGIKFKAWRIQITEILDKDKLDIGKELDPTNSKDLSDYIQLFTHLFNKKKFEKLPERREWDYKINLIEKALKKLNVKVCIITIKEEEALNQ